MHTKKIYNKKLFLLLFNLIYSANTFAQMVHHLHHETQMHPMSPNDCDETTIWDFESGNCMPKATSATPVTNWMLHGNAFLVEGLNEGARGRNLFSIPNMLMGDIGSTFGQSHYVNAELMLTFEKWTFPNTGYPELLQIGERDADDRPYVDGQHPHSTPVMGITFSDTITLDDEGHLKLYFAPRGQVTEGPIAFMHRVTGMINPDAPLGHHIGQDVSHISSTVFAASLHQNRATFEASVFNGTEPQPTEIDLPVDKINSFAARFIFEFTDNFYAMTSAAVVNDPEHHDPTLEKIYRYSSSFYYDRQLLNGLMFHNTFIFGLVNYYDHISKLRSFGDEFLLHTKDLPHNLWGRVEVLERGAGQLQIVGANEVKWVQVFTLGYTYDILKMKYAKLGLGASVSKNYIPASFEGAYGKNPLAGRLFIQLMGMRMGNF